MKGRDRYTAALVQGIVLFALTLLVGAAVTLLAGCTRTVYMPVESTAYHTDTVRLTAVRADSLFRRDSVAVYVSGDTVRITQYRDRYRVRERIDTVYRAVMDTARVEVPVPVERELTKWERTKMDFGGAAIGVLAVAACVAVVWLIRAYKK